MRPAFLAIEVRKKTVSLRLMLRKDNQLRHSLGACQLEARHGEANLLQLGDNAAVWSALKGNKGGRTVAQMGSSPKWAMACLRADIIVYFFPNTSRTILSLACCTSAAASCHAAYSAWMGAGLTFAVAEMQPHRRGAYSPAGTTRSPQTHRNSRSRRHQAWLSCCQFPELSLMPAMVPG